jgi:hypothetical protein
VVSRQHHPQLLSSKGPNYQRGELLISAGASEGHFEGKTPLRGKVTKGLLFLHDSAPAHRALTTRKKIVYMGFQCLDHPPCHLFPGLKKTLERSLFFVRQGGHCCLGDMVGIFLNGLQMLEQRAKKCIEFHGECE